jgi:hypothetical protein
MDGMVKLIYSSAFDTTVDVGVRMIEDPRELSKSASTIFGCDYDQLRPDKDHMALHLTALGDFEHYGSNRNGDGFPKKACINYHDTFVKQGNVFRHHRNKDPEKRLGQVVKSAFNGPMARIELFAHVHKDKASDELQKLATDGDIPFSMACKVAFDRCSICSTLRKSAKDPDQCQHVMTSLGKVGEDGKVVCTLNDEPNFFDISFVTRPADRIAWHLKAASGEIIDSVKLAEAEGIWVPDHLAIVSPDAQDKLGYIVKLATFEKYYADVVSGRRPTTSAEHYAWELRKAAMARLDDATISALRKYEPKEVFRKLAAAGIIMDVDTFFKYAMGLDYGEIAQEMDAVRKRVRGVYSRLSKEAKCQVVCNDRLFDVDTMGKGESVSTITTKVAEDHTMIGTGMEQRIVDTTVTNRAIALDTNDEIRSNDTLMVDALSEKYAAYKLSAIKAVQAFNKNTDTDALIAIAAVQNMVQ